LGKFGQAIYIVKQTYLNNQYDIWTIKKYHVASLKISISKLFGTAFQNFRR